MHVGRGVFQVFQCRCAELAPRGAGVSDADGVKVVVEEHGDIVAERALSFLKHLHTALLVRRYRALVAADEAIKR